MYTYYITHIKSYIYLMHQSLYPLAPAPWQSALTSKLRRPRRSRWPAAQLVIAPQGGSHSILIYIYIYIHTYIHTYIHNTYMYI